MSASRLERELVFLQCGPTPADKPMGVGTVDFVVRCNHDAPSVLARAKSVLELVDQAGLHEWPAGSAWFEIIPDWFKARCAPELGPNEAELKLAKWKKLPPEQQRQMEEEGWSVLNWIYWLDPDNRTWYWWNDAVRDANTIQVTVEAEDWPMPWGSLRWLFRAAGAVQVDAVD